MFVTTDPSRRRVRHQYYPRALIDWVCHRLRLMMTSRVCVCVCRAHQNKDKQIDVIMKLPAGCHLCCKGIWEYLEWWDLTSSSIHCLLHTHTQPWAHYICVLIHFVWIFRYSGFPSATAMGRTYRASHPGIILLCLLDNRLGLLNQIHYFIKHEFCLKSDWITFIVKQLIYTLLWSSHT